MSAAELARFLSELAEHARTDLYSAFNVHLGKGYQTERQPITNEVIDAHLAGRQPIAVYPMEGEAARLAVLDIDNHDGEFGWNEVVERVFPLVADLVGEGFRPLIFRSGGGNGIHVWILWEGPQRARRIRRFLTRLAARHSLTIGTTGIRQRTLEIYPKQDRVEPNGIGNPIALPLARESVPLDAELNAIEIEQYRPPRLEDHYGPALPEEDDPLSPDHGGSSAAAADVVLDGDLGEAQAALQMVPAGDYDIWIRMALILKFTFGDDGFEVWRSWSETSKDKYAGEAKCRHVWDGLRPTGAVRLGSLFRAAQERGWNGPSDPVIREMNERFGILTHGNKTAIIVKNGDRREEDLFWLSKQSFMDRLAGETTTVLNPAGNPTRISKAKYWLNHPRAAHSHRIVFDPESPPGHEGLNWNLWSGFGVAPIPGGSWEKLKEHILINICGADEQINSWLLNWMALGVQQPGLVIGTAPVLYGLPGTGKGFLANAYGRLWGRHYVTITHKEQVAGRFNNHLVGMRFVFVDEGTFGGDRGNAGVIKTRVTEPLILFEAKGVDAIPMKNRMIFMVASNEASIVPADIADRRWQVFAVGNRNREDRSFFAAAQGELDDGGYEAMLHELLHHDVTQGPDPRKTIKTAALFDQIIRAAAPEVRYLHQVLDEGVLPQGYAPGNGPGVTTIQALWSELQESHPSARYVESNALGRTIQKIIPNIKTVQSGTFVARPGEPRLSTRYHFPPLADCRRAFETHVGQAVLWSNDLADWQEGPPQPQEPF